MKKNATAKALIMSVLALMLCLSMLVGTTFAWFTDSVKSGVNKIVAGNLDVDLQAKVNGIYTSVTEETNLFLKNALWEPGHVEVVNLKVANVGTLALTYKLGINKVNETGSVNVYGDTFKLSEYIKFALIDGDVTFGEGDAGRAAAIAAAEANSPAKLSTLLTPNEQDGVLLPKGKGTFEKYVTLVVYMPTTVDNNANYRQGEAIPTITLGVKLEATQTPYENDSFNDQYDKNAKDDILTGTTEWFDAAAYDTTDEYSVAKESDLLALQRAVAEGYDFAGKTVTLTGDVDISAFENWAPIGSEEMPFSGTFDGAGKTVSGLKITEDANGLAGLFGNVSGATIKDLKVSGNITINSTTANELIVGGICAKSDTVTITGCTNEVVVDVSNSGAPQQYVGGIIGGAETSAILTNCTNNANLTASAEVPSFVGGIVSAKYQQTIDTTGSTNKGTLTGMFNGSANGGIIGLTN